MTPRRRRHAVGIAVALALGLVVSPRADVPPPEVAAGEYVVLLHGLARSPRAMKGLERRLRAAGYAVENVGYPSTRRTPRELVARIDRHVRDCCRDDRPVHFVTHSLGGVLTRAYLAEERPPNLGRVVMLSPPNHGSELVDRFGRVWLFAKILGPTASQLGTDPESLPNRIGPPDYELGIITGNLTLNPVSAWILSGRDDGAVSVESAQLEGMADFLVVRESHTLIRSDPYVGEQVVHFLRHGRFAAPEKNGEPPAAPPGSPP
ncbi:MAG: alpha/beta fold hydrolase [Proteobacteria bacterium]|nr:alpha/beta fold hydrolase [Pseudomonadota bacterium]